MCMCVYVVERERGRVGRREKERVGGKREREGGREGWGRERGRERVRERGRERVREREGEGGGDRLLYTSWTLSVVYLGQPH